MTAKSRPSAAAPRATANQRAVARAVEVAGGQLRLARAIGASQSTVWEWLKRSPRGVHPEWVLRVEAATGVPRHHLRPDLYPPPAIVIDRPAAHEAA